MGNLSYDKLTCETVMLPQKDYFEKAQIGAVDISGIMLHGSGLDYYTTSYAQWIHSILNIGGTPQHLYIISERTPQPGEWCISINGDGTGKEKTELVKYISGSAGAKYKIEATTDKSVLTDMFIHEDFIRSFITKTKHGLNPRRVKMTMIPATNEPAVQPETKTVFLTHAKTTFTEEEFLKGLHDITYDIINKTATACLDHDSEKLQTIKSIFQDSEHVKKYINDWYNNQNF